MPKKKNKRWSYSRYSQYKDCPAMYEWNYLMGKKKFVTSPAMERGKDIHKKAENYVNGIITGLPNELKNFKKEFQSLKREFKKEKGFCEPDISMTKNFERSTMKETDWFIGFADFVHFGDELTVIDYKTGRKYPSHQDQGHAYSMSLLCSNPDVENINVEFWYLDDPEPKTNIKTFNHTQKDRDKMLELWQRRINKMYSDKHFEATPYKWCKSCNRNVKNGGDCNG